MHRACTELNISYSIISFWLYRNLLRQVVLTSFYRGRNWSSEAGNLPKVTPRVNGRAGIQNLKTCSDWTQSLVPLATVPDVWPSASYFCLPLPPKQGLKPGDLYRPFHTWHFVVWFPAQIRFCSWLADGSWLDEGVGVNVNSLLSSS